MQCKVPPESQVFQKQLIEIIWSSVLMWVWADAKINNLVFYDRAIFMLWHTHEYYCLGHTLGSLQAFVSKSGTHCIHFELRVGFRSKFK